MVTANSVLWSRESREGAVKLWEEGGRISRVLVRLWASAPVQVRRVYTRTSAWNEGGRSYKAQVGEYPLCLPGADFQQVEPLAFCPKICGRHIQVVLNEQPDEFTGEEWNTCSVYELPMP
jgi:hypothetical protein